MKLFVFFQIFIFLFFTDRIFSCDEVYNKSNNIYTCDTGKTVYVTWDTNHLYLLSNQKIDWPKDNTTIKKNSLYITQSISSCHAILIPWSYKNKPTKLTLVREHNKTKDLILIEASSIIDTGPAQKADSILDADSIIKVPGVNKTDLIIECDSTIKTDPVNKANSISNNRSTLPTLSLKNFVGPKMHYNFIKNKTKNDVYHQAGDTHFQFYFYHNFLLIIDIKDNMSFSNTIESNNYQFIITQHLDKYRNANGELIHNFELNREFINIFELNTTTKSDLSQLQFYKIPCTSKNKFTFKINGALTQMTINLGEKGNCFDIKTMDNSFKELPITNSTHIPTTNNAKSIQQETSDKSLDNQILEQNKSKNTAHQEKKDPKKTNRSFLQGLKIISFGALTLFLIALIIQKGYALCHLT